MTNLLKSPRMLVALAGLVIVSLLAGLISVLPQSGAAQEAKPAKPGGGGASVPVQVLAIQPASLQQKITLTGDFQPHDRVSIVSRVSSWVAKLPVDVGQSVKQGDVLVQLDRSSLEAALGQAQAQLAIARANYKRLETGARPEDVTAAQASAKQAQERLTQAQNAAGALRAQDVASAQAAVAAAQARLRQVTQGPTAADVENAQAALRGAQARYQTVLNGAKPQDIDIAVQALNTQKENRNRLESQLANAKEQARLAVDQASSALRAAQGNYGAAKLIYDEAARTGKDPNVATPCPPANRKCNELTDARLRQYKAAYEAAEQTMRQAEQALEGRRLAYEDAKRQEILSLQQAEAAVLSAQATVDKLKAGATPEEADAAKAAVDQAQAALDRLNQPARSADVDAAQAAVNQARAALAKLQASPTDITTAQAALEAAQALAEKAAAPFVLTDFEVSQAQVQQAEAAVKTAEVNLRDTVITAPFAGVIAAKNVSEGALAAPQTVLLELVSVDVRGVFTVEEAQVGQVKLSQPATLTSTAYPGEKFQGTVSIINPTANASTRSFGIRITPQDPQKRLRSGMFAQAELVTAEKPNALAAPEGAVLTREGKTVVFVVAEGKAQRREVKTGLRADGKIEIVDGLKAGDQVIVVGQNLVNDGDNVQVRQ